MCVHRIIQLLCTVSSHSARLSTPWDAWGETMARNQQLKSSKSTQVGSAAQAMTWQQKMDIKVWGTTTCWEILKEESNLEVISKYVKTTAMEATWHENKDKQRRCKWEDSGHDIQYCVMIPIMCNDTRHGGAGLWSQTSGSRGGWISEFEASLVYIVSSRLAGATGRYCLLKNSSWTFSQTFRNES